MSNLTLIYYVNYSMLAFILTRHIIYYYLIQINTGLFNTNIFIIYYNYKLMLE